MNRPESLLQFGLHDLMAKDSCILRYFQNFWLDLTMVVLSQSKRWSASTACYTAPLWLMSPLVRAARCYFNRQPRRCLVSPTY